MEDTPSTAKWAMRISLLLGALVLLVGILLLTIEYPACNVDCQQEFQSAITFTILGALILATSARLSKTRSTTSYVIWLLTLVLFTFYWGGWHPPAEPPMIWAGYLLPIAAIILGIIPKARRSLST